MRPGHAHSVDVTVKHPDGFPFPCWVSQGFNSLSLIYDKIFAQIAPFARMHSAVITVFAYCHPVLQYQTGRCRMSIIVGKNAGTGSLVRITRQSNIRTLRRLFRFCRFLTDWFPSFVK